MDDGLSIYPLEFYVIGTPRSLQARTASKERWQQSVRAAANQRIDAMDAFEFLGTTPLALTIYYFPLEPMQGDVDNIVKPIQDAMVRVAYLDDQLIEKVVVQRFEPTYDWDIAEPTEQLAAALDIATDPDNPQPVVYIRVVSDLSWRRL